MKYEEKAIEILNSYKNQLLDRKPFNGSFVDMQWAISTILLLYDKEKEKK